ncbi:hypothetical protein EV715DRAFT_291895 [Schizophyllum commune]
MEPVSSTLYLELLLHADDNLEPRFRAAHFVLYFFSSAHADLLFFLMQEDADFPDWYEPPKPRPVNRFIRFRSRVCKEIAARNIGLVQQSHVSRVAGHIWREKVPEDAKDLFKPPDVPEEIKSDDLSPSHTPLRRRRIVLVEEHSSGEEYYSDGEKFDTRYCRATQRVHSPTAPATKRRRVATKEKSPYPHPQLSKPRKQKRKRPAQSSHAGPGMSCDMDNALFSDEALFLAMSSPSALSFEEPEVDPLTFPPVVDFMNSFDYKKLLDSEDDSAQAHPHDEERYQSLASPRHCPSLPELASDRSAPSLSPVSTAPASPLPLPHYNSTVMPKLVEYPPPPLSYSYNIADDEKPDDFKEPKVDEPILDAAEFDRSLATESYSVDPEPATRSSQSHIDYGAGAEFSEADIAMLSALVQQHGGLFAPAASSDSLSDWSASTNSAAPRAIPSSDPAGSHAANSPVSAGAPIADTFFDLDPHYDHLQGPGESKYYDNSNNFS